jgi:hypothetical protein
MSTDRTAALELRSGIEGFVDFLYEAIALFIGQPREMAVTFGPRQRAVILMNHVNEEVERLRGPIDLVF